MLERFCKAGICFSTLFIAGAVIAAQAQRPYQFELFGGYNRSHGNISDLTISSSDAESDTLRSNGSDNSFIGGGGIAYDFLAHIPQKPAYPFQEALLGLDLAFFDTKNKGDVYWYGNPDEAYSTYDLKVKTARLMLNGELSIRTPWKRFFPFIQASAGIARLSTEYNDKSVEGITGGNINLSSQVNYNFAYSFGGGVKYKITPAWQIAISYLYTDLGTAETSTDSDNIQLEEPIRYDLQTSSILFGLSYLFK